MPASADLLERIARAGPKDWWWLGPRIGGELGDNGSAGQPECRHPSRRWTVRRSLRTYGWANWMSLHSRIRRLYDETD